MPCCTLKKYNWIRTNWSDKSCEEWLSSGRPCSTLNTQLESHYPVQCGRHSLVLICRIKIPRVLVAVMLIIVVPWLPLCPSRVTWQLLSLSVLSRPCSGPRIQNKSWQGWLQSPEQILGTLLYYTILWFTHTKTDGSLFIALEPRKGIPPFVFLAILAYFNCLLTKTDSKMHL